MTATIPKGFHPEPFSYHQELELDIDALSNAGDGIGRVDGWVVFVPFALPGNRARRKAYGRGSHSNRTQPRRTAFG